MGKYVVKETATGIKFDLREEPEVRSVHRQARRDTF